MLTGKRFEFKTSLVALETVAGERVAHIFPRRSRVLVISGPVGTDRMVEVLFESRAFTMFAVDLREFAIEIEERTSGADV